MNQSMTGSLLVAMVLIGGLLKMSEGGVINLSYGLQSTTGAYGGNGGLVTAASLSSPNACWLNSNGEAYISDQGNYRIRKVDLSGIISAYFGAGGYTVTGNRGAATSAGGLPGFISGDTTGNIYFSDGYNSVVRKIDSSQVVTAYAGGGSLGLFNSADNGAAATAVVISGCHSITCDSNGDVYVGDDSSSKIKKISASSRILTYVAGTGDSASPDISANNGDGGQATAALLSTPSGVFIDSTGVLYFASYLTGNIRRINLTTGIIVTYAGGTGSAGNTGDGGPATSAMLQSDSPYLGGDLLGRIYYSTKFYNNVRVIDTYGIITRFAGSSEDTSGYGTSTAGYTGNGGEATAALLSKPSHVFVKDSLVYITESGNNVIRSVAISISSSNAPSAGPTLSPSCLPTTLPTACPSVVPSLSPLVLPSVIPSIVPSVVPSVHPSVLPSTAPSPGPSVLPSVHPSVLPSAAPSPGPSVVPTTIPTSAPSYSPSESPSLPPTVEPSVAPTISPSSLPTETPTLLPTATPSAVPTLKPSAKPSLRPTLRPTVRPSRASVLTVAPTFISTVAPTAPIVVISFDSNVYLHNVTTSSLDTTSQTAVTSSVASTLSVNNSQVSFVSQSVIGATTRRRLSEVGYQILVTVNVVSSTADFADAVNHNASFLFHRLSQTLMGAVESNAFTHTLRETSAVLGAMSTLYVGHVNVTVTEYDDVTPDVSEVNGHKTTDLSVGDYVGIVIGIIVSFLLLTAWCYFGLVRSRKSGEDNSKA